MKFIPLLLAAACLLGGGAARAEAPALNLLMQQDVLWARNGVPTAMRALAQTPDGWLWLGGQSGLYRFDGVRFERYDGRAGKLPLSNIFEMGSTAQGALWLSYRYGGLSIMQDGKLLSYSAADGLPAGTLHALAAMPDGRLYVGGPNGVYAKAPDAERWQAVTGPGAPRDAVHGMIAASDGALWVQSSDGVFTMAPGAAQFERRSASGGLGVVREAPDGSVWASSATQGGLRMLRGPRQGAPVKWPTLGRSFQFLFDRAGNLWLQQDGGVAFVPALDPGASVYQSSGRQGASGMPEALLQDREGNVWMVNGRALERFRAKRFARIALPPYMAEGRPIAALPDGAVWVDRYAVTGPRGPAKSAWSASTPADIVSTVHAGPGGTLWQGGNAGLYRIAGGTKEKIALPAGMEGGPIYAIADTPSGVWISIALGGLYVLRDGRWIHEGGYPELKTFRPTSMGIGRAGRLWLGSTGNRLALVDGGKVSLFGPQQGLLVGTSLSIRAEGEALWVGGENGVFRFDGARFVQLAGADDDFLGASGITFDRAGAMWINGLGGITRIDAAELAEAARRPGYRVRYRRYDNRDGLEGSPAQIAALPSAVTGSDGRLWFSMGDGVYTFLPDQLPDNRLAPPVYVTGLKGDGTPYAADGKAVLAPGTGTVQIDYTALSLVTPERMAFRYRLVGVDQHWQQAGTRRAALYTGLAPGRYRFEVKASNNDGVWNEEGAAMVFRVEPTLVQTAWFRVLCVLAALAAGWLLHRWRLRRAAGHALARVQERLGERERIARELHDTVLQSVQGLLMQVHAAAMLLSSREDQAHRVLTVAVERASAAIEEGRDRVHALRSHSDARYDLAAAIGEGLLDMGDGPQAGIVKRGRERALQAPAREEVCAIAREALRNALRHSDARQVAVEIDFRADALHLSVRDDGKGVAPEVLAAGGKAGHWGLASIRERAHKIGATAQLDSSAQGSCWQLRLPARLAYARAPSRWFGK